MTQSKYLSADDFWTALKFDQTRFFYVLSLQFGKLLLLMFHVVRLIGALWQYHFQNVFRLRKNEMSAFSNQFLRFRDGSVWTLLLNKAAFFLWCSVDGISVAWKRTMSFIFCTLPRERCLTFQKTAAEEATENRTAGGSE